MPNPSLMHRAAALMQRHVKQAAGLALIPLAAAPVAAQITFNPGMSQVFLAEGDLGFFSVFDPPQPLAPVGGTNATDQVSLTGQAGIVDEVSNPSITFINVGTITADAGEFVRVDYDFTQSFSSSSGGSYADFGFELSLEIDGATVSDSGFFSSTDIPSDSAGTTQPQSGEFQTLAFASDLTDAPLTLSFNSTAAVTGGPPLGFFAVDVPADGLTLSVVPEPASLVLLSLGGAVLAVGRRRAR